MKIKLLHDKQEMNKMNDERMFGMIHLQAESMNFVMQLFEEIEWIFREIEFAMEKNIHIIRVKPSSRNEEYLLNEYYSSPSLTKKAFDKKSQSQKQVPFSVEWQMHNAWGDPLKEG